MSKTELLYNKILKISMFVAIISFILLIVDLFLAVTQQAIKCTNTIICTIDSQHTFFQATIWMFGILVIIFVIIARVMLFILTRESKLEDATSYKSRILNQGDSSDFSESKLYDDIKENRITRRSKRAKRPKKAKTGRKIGEVFGSALESTKEFFVKTGSKTKEFLVKTGSKTKELSSKTGGKTKEVFGKATNKTKEFFVNTTNKAKEFFANFKDNRSISNSDKAVKKEAKVAEKAVQNEAKLVEKEAKATEKAVQKEVNESEKELLRIAKEEKKAEEREASRIAKEEKDAADLVRKEELAKEEALRQNELAKQEVINKKSRDEEALLHSKQKEKEEENKPSLVKESTKEKEYFTRLNKTELIALVAEASDLSKAKCKLVVNAFVDIIVEELGNGNEVNIGKFGKFKKVITKTTREVNPKTGKIKEFPEESDVKFLPDKLFKEMITDDIEATSDKNLFTKKTMKMMTEDQVQEQLIKEEKSKEHLELKILKKEAKKAEKATRKAEKNAARVAKAKERASEKEAARIAKAEKLAIEKEAARIAKVEKEAADLARKEKLAKEEALRQEELAKEEALRQKELAKLEAIDKKAREKEALRLSKQKEKAEKEAADLAIKDKHASEKEASDLVKKKATEKLAKEKDVKVAEAPKPVKVSKPKEVKKTKADIIEYIESKTGISKNKSNKFLKFFAEVVKEELAKGKDVNIPGFGLFTTIEMPAKEAVNPQTNKKIIVPAHNQARLRFDDKFKKKFEVK